MELVIIRSHNPCFSCREEKTCREESIPYSITMARFQLRPVLQLKKEALSKQQA